MRRALPAALILTAIAALAAAIAGLRLYDRARTDTTGTLAFERPLRIPPLLEPRADASGRKVFDLRLQTGTTELSHGRAAQTWGVNGPHLGPTLRAARGDDVRMRVHNALPERTTLHWHGMHLPAHADGGPHQMIEPGRTWTPSWEIEQPAATLWYHAHLMGATERHVHRGLAGMWILDEPGAERLPLPRRYGVDDIPLLLQDARLDDDGALDESNAPISPTGRLGDDMLVNCTRDRHLRVSDRLVRFRLLNASSARIYAIGFADDRRFTTIASDAGLLERPVERTRIQLSPGERAEIVAGFEPGERVVLRSHAPELGTDFFHDRFSGGDDTLDLLEVRAAPELGASPALPRRLAAPAPPSADVVRARRFELSGSSRINGRRMDMARIDEVLEPGATEIWDVANPGATPHNFHPHGVSFRIPDIGGDRPPAHLAGFKDTVFVPPGETVRLLLRAPRHADHHAPYMLHCHLLQHEDRGMMGQFVTALSGS
ncbi:MAG TPA: multicopper oxidase domain-containing protein [Solirubrobacteraceae bacterium]|nr:multicopper oxidase domain-containing protein [Solirubrobacteraceae bacterium]